MKNKLFSFLLFSILASVCVSAADSPAIDIMLGSVETRTTEIELPDVVNPENPEEMLDILDVELITEAKYTNDSGFSLWYNIDTLKPSEYGGQLCFIPLDEEEALKASSVLIIVPNEPGETPSPLEEVTAMYPEEAVSEVEIISLESGIEIQSVTANEEDKTNTFYIVSCDDLSLNITSMVANEELELYEADFQRLVESISFETSTPATE